jgi:phospholipid/cholesterol/gamma-HCH transport system ATP-binding protein
VLPRSDETSHDASSNGNGGPPGLEVEISIRGLTKSFGSQTILDDITCDIPKGKITLMLGPSGTGKSVFLKNIMGLLKPERGEIWIDGKDIVKLGSRDLYKVRRKFGVLFQDGALFGSMNIYDNVAFPLREHTRKPEREIKQIVDEKLSMVGLQGAEKKLPGEISGGMKKRAGLARALVLDPEIVMFDEPDSGLDPVRTAFLNELILDLNRQLKATFIVVTHDIATARRVADFIGMLYLRNLVRFDTKENMFNSDIPVVRQFLAGATEGPIGMSEEADAGRGGSAPPEAVSTSGMTAEETEALERDAGAPQDSGESKPQVVALGKQADGDGEAKSDGEGGAQADGEAEAKSEGEAEAKTESEGEGEGDSKERSSDDSSEEPEQHAAGESKTPEELAVGDENEPEGRDDAEDAAIAESQADRQGLDSSPASPGDDDSKSAEAREEQPEAPDESGDDDPQTEPERPAGGGGTETEPDEASANEEDGPKASEQREEKRE